MRTAAPYRAPRGWPKLKRLVFRRDGGICRQCATATAFEGGTADHVQPVSQGGGHSPDNLQWLCHACHRAKTNREIADGFRRKSIRSNPMWGVFEALHRRKSQ